MQGESLKLSMAQQEGREALRIIACAKERENRGTDFKRGSEKYSAGLSVWEEDVSVNCASSKVACGRGHLFFVHADAM